ncbi:PepSY domain-containing protein [Flexivirga sp. B27]
MAVSTKQKRLGAVVTVVAAGAIGLTGCGSSSSGGSSPAGSTDPASSASSSPTSGSTSPRTGVDDSPLPQVSHGSTIPAGPSGSSAADTGAVGNAGVDLAKAAFPVTLDRAIAVARTELAGGTITKLGLDFDTRAGRWVWEVDAQKGTKQRELKIDAGTGKVIGGEHDDESSEPRAVDPKKLTPEAAIKKATALVPGTVAEWTLHHDDGVQRYEIEIRTGGSDTQDVVVPVDTGKAVRD